MAVAILEKFLGISAVNEHFEFRADVLETHFLGSHERKLAG
jgi:hypothetical protein